MGQHDEVNAKNIVWCGHRSQSLLTPVGFTPSELVVFEKKLR